MKIIKSGFYARSLNLHVYFQLLSKRGHHLSSFNPSLTEKKWQKIYATDEPKDYKASKSSFSMVLPPPNVTGSLHLGHALTVSIQDAIVRWHKMRGMNTVWVPGCDHAGIATQAVVERQLLAAKGKRRADMPREQFMEMISVWKNDNESRIYEQLQTLGLLLDWDRKTFTLDPNMSKSVTEAFIRLYNDGLIYRKFSLANWCVALQTSLSDIEVDYLEIESPKSVVFPSSKGRSVLMGQIYEIAYPVEGIEAELTVLTTRPETVFGDVALAVHPKDQRYTAFVGSILAHPITGRRIPVISDDSVDMDFGTGVVKITPAHDTLDYEIGQRHSLEMIQIFNENGDIQNAPEQYLGKSRFDARDAVLETFSQMGLLRGSKSHKMAVPICSRSGDLIELMPRPQWYVKCEPLAEKAIEYVKSGELKLIPKYHEGVWFEYLRNIRDWCVSRQLWWGHQIPMYKLKGCEDTWFPAPDHSSALDIAKAKYNSEDIVQDQDVLDTWFSSSLFPFAVFDWPNNNQDMKRFFPLSLMETGSDILFFWVARMVMMSSYLTGKLPFREVLLHGMICDAGGRKMSKSKGNVIDPVDVINGISKKELEAKATRSWKEGIISKDELNTSLVTIDSNFSEDGIKQVGVDGLRLALCSYDIKNDMIKVDTEHLYFHRLFLNKTWQAMNFLLINLDKAESLPEVVTLHSKNPVNAWILERLYEMLRKVEMSFLDYDLHLVTKAIIQFMYFELCDVYLECAKPMLVQKDDVSLETISTLIHCLEVGLRTLAPFTPFFADEMYEILHSNLMQRGLKLEGFPASGLRATNAKYPASEEWATLENPKLKDSMKLALEVVKVVRAIKARSKMTKHKPNVFISGPLILEEQLSPLCSVVTTLSRIQGLHFASDDKDLKQQENYGRESFSHGTIFVELETAVNTDIRDQILKLHAKRDKHSDYLSYMQKISKSSKELKRLRMTKDSCAKKMENIRKELKQVEEELEVLKHDHKADETR
ncbi:probable valine--tRNA ligase, cytoplasmic [Artemia franciscana]|uniref:valine--tRNA ligase n=1 Tax=Artemia franciscana TaxID=6661 RepID=A0AA88H7P1_ARTSF|nr:hypothetical protein QYM36_016433 [Artemia franciscana]